MSALPAATPATPLPWRIEDIDLGAIDTARVRDDRRHTPVEMAVRILLEPIDLPHALTRVLVPVLTRSAGLVFI